MIGIEIILAVLTAIASISGAIAVRRTMCTCGCGDVNIQTEPLDKDKEELSDKDKE